MKVYGIYCDSFFRQKPWFLPRKFWLAIVNRANPRSFEYMTDLFLSHYPDGEIAREPRIEPSEKVILLYPDSIGLGQGKLEKRIVPGISVWALNGRRRHFELSERMRRKLKIRRLLEISIAPEILLAPILLVFALGLSFIDRIRNRS
jgi:hypothetical protein